MGDIKFWDEAYMNDFYFSTLSKQSPHNLDSQSF